MTAEQRHANAMITPPAPLAERPPMAGARRYGNQLITSGQTAHIGGANIANGVVGANIDLATARECAWQCARNVVSAAAAEIKDLSLITSVTRVTVFVAATADFTDHHLVGDAATAYFHEVFGPTIGLHTRAAIGMASLPTGSPVEVEAIFQLSE